MSQYEQLNLYTAVASDDELKSVFDQAVQTLVKKEPRPRVEARFYPYAGLSSTIRLRDGRLYARVSDILAGSPRDVLFALACMLVSKLYRLRAPKAQERTYREHTLHPSMVEASRAARRKRGYKITTSSRGNVYDLSALFNELNQRYFENQLERPILSWSPRQTRSVLGHHDNVHRAIVVSSSLDDSKVPRFVVEYVLYHEMLHVKHSARTVSGRTIYHGRDFRKDEKRFDRFDEAAKWLDKFASRSRRKRRKPRHRVLER